MTVGDTRLGSARGAKATKKTPSGKSDNFARAASMPRRVLPIPGGPTKVTRRMFEFDRYSLSLVSSCSRPISDVREAGKFERGERQGVFPTPSPGADSKSPREKCRIFVLSSGEI